MFPSLIPSNRWKKNCRSLKLLLSSTKLTNPKTGMTIFRFWSWILYPWQRTARSLRTMQHFWKRDNFYTKKTKWQPSKTLKSFLWNFSIVMEMKLLKMSLSSEFNGTTSKHRGTLSYIGLLFMIFFCRFAIKFKEESTNPKSFMNFLFWIRGQFQRKAKMWGSSNPTSPKGYPPDMDAQLMKSTTKFIFSVASIANKRIIWTYKETSQGSI